MTCQSKSFSRKDGKMVCNECDTVHPQARSQTRTEPEHDCIRDGCTTTPRSKKRRAAGKVADLVEDIVEGICDAAAGIANGIGKILD